MAEQVHLLQHQNAGGGAEFPFEAVIWDVDDVLVDTAWLFSESRTLALAALGVLPEEIDRAIDVWNQLLWYFDQDNVAGILRALTAELQMEESSNPRAILESMGVYNETWSRRIRPVAGILRIVSALDDAHIPQGIVSNGDRTYQLEKLASIGILELIPLERIVVEMSGSQQAKPQPDGVIKVCNVLAVPPSQAVYVGDRLSDVVAANLAGSVSILFEPALKSPEYKSPGFPFLRIEHPTYIAQNIHDLARLLGFKN